MKIIYLHQYFNTPKMAGGIRSYEMARRLVARGHEVQMVTSSREKAPRSSKRWSVTNEEGILVHWTHVPYNNRMSLNRRLRAFVEFSTRAAGRAASLDGDVVFATSTPLTIALPAIYAARLKRIPMVFEVRDLWPDVPVALGALRNPVQRWAAYQLERFAYRSSAEIVALAPGMKEAIVEKGYPADRVSVIPNGANLELFGAGRAAGEDVRRRFQWLGDRPLCVYIGTLGRANGVDYLAHVAAAAQRLDPQTRFAVVGDGACRGQIEEVAAQLGVLERNFFLMGEVSKTEAAAWLSAASISVALLTGPEIVWRDSVSNKFFDALAAGKPVANNFRGFSAIVAEHAGAGLILDAHNPAAAAESLVAAINDPEWLNRAGAASARLGREQFNLDDLAVRLEEVLVRVTSRSIGASGRHSPGYVRS